MGTDRIAEFGWADHSAVGYKQQTYNAAQCNAARHLALKHARPRHYVHDKLLEDRRQRHHLRSTA
eukprot:4704447-Pyramimonas_sp.AAC.1